MKEIKGPTLPARVQRVQKVQKVQRVVVGALQNKGRQYEKCTTALADEEKAIEAAPPSRLVFTGIVVTYCFYQDPSLRG